MASMRILLCEPGRGACVSTIGSDAYSIENIIGGSFKCRYLGNKLMLVCSADEKTKEQNRVVKDKRGNPEFLVYGTFFVCAEGEDRIESIKDWQLSEALTLLRLPTQK